MSRWNIYSDHNIYFLTTSVVEWISVFTDHTYFTIVTESLDYCRRNKGLKLYAYVVMLDHLHLLVSVEQNNSERISGIMRDFKRYTSKCISAKLIEDKKSTKLKVFQNAAEEFGANNDFKVWQSGFHPVAIESEKFCRQKLHYIHINPVKKGFVVEPQDWFYSSARNYASLSNVPIQIDSFFE